MSAPISPHRSSSEQDPATIATSAASASQPDSFKVYSPSQLSQDDEEKLPLYEEQHTPFIPITSSESPPTSANDIPLPSDAATPDDVRAYLIQVMTAQGVAPGTAQSIAARWQSGSGRELKTYPAAMFFKIFGLEDGWRFYKVVNVRMLVLEKKKREKFIVPTFAIISFILAIPSVVCWVIFSFKGTSVGFFFIPFILSLLSLFAFCYSMDAWKTVDHEAIIEYVLQEAMKKEASARQS